MGGAPLPRQFSGAMPQRDVCIRAPATLVEHPPQPQAPPLTPHPAPLLRCQVNATGVMPVIFSSSLLALPSALSRYANLPALEGAARALAPNGPAYLPVRCCCTGALAACPASCIPPIWPVHTVCAAHQGPSLLPRSHLLFPSAPLAPLCRPTCCSSRGSTTCTPSCSWNPRS